jgi:phenylpyruvate tautomerase PptA (4-oxalocrotonate tautomerase family)
MPFWQIFHPTDAYTAEDKKVLAKRITALYENSNLPKFYVVTVFHPVPTDSFHVGGEPRSNFVRFKIDQMARTMSSQVLRDWWMRRVEDVIAPFVKERGLESEVQIDELPADLWTMNGLVPPPFESHAEKRWAKENKPSAYANDEMMSSAFRAGPGITGGR